MILKSKLKNTYPTADPKIWLSGKFDGEDPVFLGRLAAYAKYCYEKSLTKIKQIKINTGIQTDAFQLILYNEAQTYKKTKKLGKYGVKSAAYPGTSYHGEKVRFAVDVDKSHPIYKAVNADLAPFGLCKPIASEAWHIQPVETVKLGSDASIEAVKNIVSIDLSTPLKKLFMLTDAEILKIESYAYAVPLADNLLAGKRTFSQGTLDYLGDLKIKLGL